MNKTLIGFFIYSFLINSLLAGETWTPKLNFSIEESSYIETLIFISGISYTINESNIRLSSENKINFFCFSSNKLIVDSKIVLDLLNAKLTGDVTAEVVIKTLVDQLSLTYPCKP